MKQTIKDIMPILNMNCKVRIVCGIDWEREFDSPIDIEYDMLKLEILFISPDKDRFTIYLLTK